MEKTVEKLKSEILDAFACGEIYREELADLLLPLGRCETLRGDEFRTAIDKIKEDLSRLVNREGR